MEFKKFVISNDDIFLCGKDNDSIVFKSYSLFISEEEMELKSKHDTFILRFENKDLKIYMNGNYIDIDYFIQYIEKKTSQIFCFAEEFNKMLEDLIKKERIKEIGYDDSYLNLLNHFCVDDSMKYLLYLGSYQFYLITERLFKRFFKRIIKDFIKCGDTSLYEIDNLLKIEKILRNKDVQWFWDNFYIYYDDMNLLCDMYNCSSIGPNGLKVLRHFFELILKTKNHYGYPFGHLEKVYNIINYYNISCQNLVDFLIRRFFDNSSIDYIVITSDCINMAKQYNIQLDKKLTSNIKEIHDKLSKKIHYLEEQEKNDIFKQKNKEYQKYLEVLPKSDKFTILIPESPKDLIQEGEDMHHCVGSYINKYAKGMSKIFFVRKKDEEDKAYVTIELNQSNHLVQIQGKYDKYPGQTVHNFVKEWCENIQKQERNEFYEQKDNTL